MTTSEIKLRTVYLMKRTDKEDDDGKDLYVGSTSKPLRVWLWYHRGSSKTKRDCNNRLYTKMREVGLDNWEMVPLLSFTCDRKTILKFEKEWCYALNADLNTLPPFLGFNSKKEYDANYRRVNKETIKQKKSEYYKVNKERISQRRTNYNETQKQNKLHYCEVCEKSFLSNRDLKRHFDSLKHQYAYLNSLD